MGGSGFTVRTVKEYTERDKKLLDDGVTDGAFGDINKRLRKIRRTYDNRR